MAILDGGKDAKGERELRLVLGLDNIPNQTMLNDLYERYNRLGKFHTQISALLNKNERKEVFDIVAKVANKTSALLPSIEAGDIDAFMMGVHAIYSEVRAKELSFQKSLDGKIVRSFEFSKKGPFNYYKNSDGLSSVGGYR